MDDADVGRLLGLSRQQVRRLAKAGRFPQPHKITGKCVRWILGEIEDWMAAGCPIPTFAPHWVWHPVSRVRKDIYAKVLQAQVVILQAEIATLETVKGDYVLLREAT